MMPVSIRALLRVIVLVGMTSLGACSESLAPGSGVVGTPSDPATETFAAALGVNLAAMTRKSDVLYIQDLVVGTGAEAVAGRTLGMVYSGWLANGTKFDSNV